MKPSSLTSFARLQARLARILPILALGIVMLVGDTLASASDAPNGITGVFGESDGHPDVVPGTGAMTYKVPFALPAARGNAQPELNLVYGSGSATGEAGFGWSLDLPTIERAPLSGAPRYLDPSDGNVTKEDRYIYLGRALTFICTVGGSPSCPSTPGVGPMPTWANGYRHYRLQIEGTFERFFLSPDRRTWIVQERSGVLKEFGAAVTKPALTPESGNVVSGCDVDATTGRVYRWNLSRQRDSHADLNTVVYRWVGTTPDRQYLKDIFYSPSPTAASTSDFAYHVELSWENPGYREVHYTPIHLRANRFRIRRVAISSSTWQATTRELVRAYQLTYFDDRAFPAVAGQAPLWNRTSLKSVAMEGACGVQELDGHLPEPTGCSTLPPVSFEYQPATLATGNAIKSDVLGTAGVGNDGLQYVLNSAVIDFNRDGRPDIVQAWAQNYGVRGHSMQHVECKTSDLSLYYVSLEDGDPHGWGATLDCEPAPPGGSSVRSAGEQIAYINRGGPPGSPLHLEHNCLDAGDGSAGTLTGFLISPVRSSPSGNVAALFNQFSAESVSSWGDADLLWSVAGYRGFGIRPTTGQSRFCANTNVGQLNYPSLKWQVFENSTTNWVLAPNDTQNIEYRQIIDIDGDGYSDLLTEPEYEPRATSPSGRFENATVRLTKKQSKYERGAEAPGPILAPFVNSVAGDDPVTVTPRSWAFSAYADVNGDGLQDLVTSDPGVDGGIPQVRPGDGKGGFGCDPAIDVACLVTNDGPWVGKAYRISSPDSAKPWPMNSSVPYDPALTDTHFLHDVTGDGLADIVAYRPGSASAPGYIKLWVNIEGSSFRCANSTDCIVSYITEPDQPNPAIPSYRVVFTDFDADGTDDFVLLGLTGVWRFSFLSMPVAPNAGVAGTRAPRPGLLTRIRNGVGAETEIVYQTIQELDMAAANPNPTAFDAPWSTHSPSVIPVVTRVWTRDSRVVAGAAPIEPYQVSRSTTYQYRDPAYDPWERSFKGWGRVRAIDGAGLATQSWRWFSACAQGGFISPDCNTASDEYPEKALEGALVRVDTFVPSSARQPESWLSTLVTSYAPVAPDSSPYFIEPSADRGVLFVPAVESNVYLYDTGNVVSPVDSITHPTTLQDVPHQGGVERRLEPMLTTYSLEGTVSRQDAFGHVSLDGNPIDPPVSTRLYPVTRCTDDWQCLVTEEKLFAPQGDGLDLLMRHAIYGYNAAGDLTSLAAELLYPQFHPAAVARDPVIGGPAPSSASVAPGVKSLRTITVDAYGNVTKVEGQSGTARPCLVTTYDRHFLQFPETSTIFAGDACTGTAETSSFVFDRGLETMAAVKRANNTLTTLTYDPFGNLSAVYAPAPDSADFATELAVQIATHAQSPASWREIRRRVDVDAFVSSIEIANGVGEPVLAFDQADTAIDGAPWVARGWLERGVNGVPHATYRPWFFSGDAYAVANTAPSLAPPGLRVANASDAFGRTSVTFEGSQTTGSFSYLPLATTVRDATSMNAASAFYGLSSTILVDGFGRTTDTTEPATDGGDTTHTHVDFLATGEPIRISRSGMADPTPYVRTMEWDSFGRLIHNYEPNSTSAGVGWAYVYDDESRLVGTSDARGCGSNLFYDARSRIVAEDDSPCTADQAPYTAPDPVTGEGTEAFYTYDVYESDQVSPTATFQDAASLAMGQLVSVQDRGAHTRFSYDARGRVRRTSRQMAVPTAAASASALADRYAARWFEQETDFDLGNRPKKLTEVNTYDGGLHGAYTGWDYSARGAVREITSNWGNLVTGIAFSASGNLRQAVYGDRAATTQTLTYDARDRLSTAHVFRASAPPLWTTSPPPSGYSLPNPSDGTTVLDLAQLAYGHDDDGATTSIRDLSSGAWTTGTTPVSRLMAYDAAHRLASVSYAYTGSASYRSPHLPEIKAGDNRPIPESFSKTRVATQTFKNDAQGNILASDDDQHLRLDRSFGDAYVGIGADGVARGPNQLLDADGMHAVYDAAGNLTELTVERSTCTSEEPDCSLRFVYDWDEVGSLSRARRYDFPAGPVPPFDPAAGPTWDLAYAYSAGARVRTSTSSGGADATHTLEIFGSHRLEHASFDPASGYGISYGYDESVYLAGGLARAFDSRDESLPRGAGSAVRVFFNIGDHLGSSSFVIDKDSGEVVERTTYQPYGAVESDFRPARWHSPRESVKFTGKEEDIEVGATYFGARFYNARLGRWMSPDPLAVHGLGADPNPYAYVGGTVFDAVDPFGLEKDPDGVDVVHVTGERQPRYHDAEMLAERAGAAAAKAASAAARWFQRAYDQSKLKDRVGWVCTTYDASQLKDSVDNPTHIPENSRKGIDALLMIEAILSIGVGAVPPAGPAPALAGGGIAVAPAPALVFPLPVGALQATTYPTDRSTQNTKNMAGKYASERDARAFARGKLGSNPVEVEDGKWRSQDGRWQYRAKPNDLAGHGDGDTPHVHLERLDPKTGEVLENWHLRW